MLFVVLNLTSDEKVDTSVMQKFAKNLETMRVHAAISTKNETHLKNA